MIIGLAVVLLIYTLLYMLVADQIKEKAKATEPEPPTLYPIRFFGGPMDGHETEGTNKRLHYYVPTQPEDEDENRYVQMGGIPMIEAVYAKYEGIGDEGDYFYVENLSREEMVREVMKENHEI